MGGQRGECTTDGKWPGHVGAKVDERPGLSRCIGPLVSIGHGHATGEGTRVARELGRWSSPSACSIEGVGTQDPELHRRLGPLVSMAPDGSNAPGAPSFLGSSSARGPSLMGCRDTQYPRRLSRRAATRPPGSKVVRSPRDRRGNRTLSSWYRSRLDIKLLLPPRRRREHGTGVLPVHRRRVSQPSKAPWDLEDPGGHGIGRPCQPWDPGIS